MSKIIEQITVKDNKTQKEIIYKSDSDLGLWYQMNEETKWLRITEREDGDRLLAFLFDYSITDTKWK